MEKYTIQNFHKDFPDEASCLEWIKNNRWPEGIYCSKCKRITKHHRVNKRPCYACDFCGNHIYPMAGTILEKSTTPLKLWFHAIFLMASTRCGISAKELQRQVGVTYKTAWRMFKQIRAMFDEGVMSLLNQVEIDDSYFGGKRRGGKCGRGSENKTIAVGMVERNGKIVAEVIPDIKTKTLMPIIKSKVLPKSIIYTDEYPSYNFLSKNGYLHKRINHLLKVYVMGTVHTNTIEGFWSLVKRGISGVHHAISAKHLQNYLNSYCFRWNHRNDKKPMFLTLLSRLSLSGKA